MSFKTTWQRDRQSNGKIFRQMAPPESAQLETYWNFWIPPCIIFARLASNLNSPYQLFNAASNSGISNDLWVPLFLFWILVLFRNDSIISFPNQKLKGLWIALLLFKKLALYCFICVLIIPSSERVGMGYIGPQDLVPPI